uniref:Trypsin n=2 Tax=Hirondellea gigas TaxID=1518452 RepID=A0A2P2IBW7_9CRUS
MSNTIFILALLFAAGATGAPLKKPLFRRGLDRIVGGSDATPGELPYQVSFQDISYGFPFAFCGASVYAETWVITSASCVQGDLFDHPDYLQVQTGVTDLSALDGSEQTVILSSIIQHEEYDGFSMANDIALLQLSSELNFDTNTQPIAMPTQGQASAGECIVSGWGTITEGGSVSDILQKVSITYISDEDCRKSYGEDDIYDSMLCAGTPEGGTGPCQGDYGGPLVCSDGQGSKYLAGVASRSYGCGRPNYPAVYTEVSYFIDWIKINSNTA